MKKPALARTIMDSLGTFPIEEITFKMAPGGHLTVGVYFQAESLECYEDWVHASAFKHVDILDEIVTLSLQAARANVIESEVNDG